MICSFGREKTSFFDDHQFAVVKEVVQSVEEDQVAPAGGEIVEEPPGLPREEEGGDEEEEVVVQLPTQGCC